MPCCRSVASSPRSVRRLMDGTASPTGRHGSQPAVASALMQLATAGIRRATAIGR